MMIKNKRLKRILRRILGVALAVAVSINTSSVYATTAPAPVPTPADNRDGNAETGGTEPPQTTNPAPDAAAEPTPTPIPRASNGMSAYEMGMVIINEALKYVGNPYVWGGDSLTEGIDCSHFCYRILQRCGIDIGGWVHSTEWQYIGERVPGIEYALPGDVVVFPGHVAFYDGQGMLVEAKGSLYGITHDRRWNEPHGGQVISIQRFTGYPITYTGIGLQPNPDAFAKSAERTVYRMGLMDDEEAEYGQTSLWYNGDDIYDGTSMTIDGLKWYWKLTQGNVFDRQAYGYAYVGGYDGDGNTQAKDLFALGDRAYNNDPEAQEQWLETIGSMVQEINRGYGVKASLVIIQIINESGWIRTPIGYNGDGHTLSENNNVLGMNNYDVLTSEQSRWYQYQTHGSFLVCQQDEITKEIYWQYEDMKTYRSVEDCIEDYIAVMVKRHPEFANNTDLSAYASFLTGYTPSENERGENAYEYYDRVIREMGLDRFD